MSDVQHIETGTERIVLAITLKATPARVYRALTEAAEIEKWFFPEAVTDPRPGGRYKFTWHSQHAASNHVREGEFIEVIPGKKVSYTWDARHIQAGKDPGTRELPTVVEFLLEEVPAGTRLTLTHSGWGDDPAWRELFTFHDEGWEFFIGNLGDVVAGHPDRRAEIMEMRPRT